MLQRLQLVLRATLHRMVYTVPWLARCGSADHLGSWRTERSGHGQRKGQFPEKGMRSCWLPCITCSISQVPSVDLYSPCMKNPTLKSRRWKSCMENPVPTPSPVSRGPHTRDCVQRAALGQSRILGSSTAQNSAPTVRALSVFETHLVPTTCQLGAFPRSCSPCTAVSSVKRPRLPVHDLTTQMG